MKQMKFFRALRKPLIFKVGFTIRSKVKKEVVNKVTCRHLLKIVEVPLLIVLLWICRGKTPEFDK